MKPIVLAIDDDPLFQKALESVLTRFGLEVKVTANPKTFLELAHAYECDLYLIDLHLTDFSGIDLIRELRSRNTTSNIIVISGDQNQATVVHALEVGANDYIQKPLDRALLASKLAKYIETPAIKEERGEIVQLKDDQLGIKLKFDVKLAQIDELGVVFESAHVIPKGTVLRLSANCFKEIGIFDEDMMVTIVSTTYENATNTYQSYAEFDSQRVDIMEQVRRWILNQK
jgi:DNA-binding response OmpR family regulator